MNRRQYKLDMLKMRALQSRSRHLTLAFVVLSAAGLFTALTEHRFALAFVFLVAANALFAWGLHFHRRALDLLSKYEKELRE